MPFASKKQARFLAVNKPKIFKRWVREAGNQVVVKPNFKRKKEK